MLPTFADFIANPWKTDCFERFSPTTQCRVQSLLRTQLLPEFAWMRLDNITSQDVHKWFVQYSQTAPAGANRALDALAQILNHAVTCGFLSDNSARGIRRNPRPKRTRFLSLAEVKQLYAALDEHQGRGSGTQQADIIRLLLLTGCRKGELIHLQWTEFDGDRLFLRGGKTGPRTVFLCAEAEAIISRQPCVGPFVFPSRNNPSTNRPSELSLWRKVRRSADISDVRLHDLRHTFASQAVLAGVPLPVVSRLLGHAKIHTTLRYAHVSDRETEAAAERIGLAISAILTCN